MYFVVFASDPVDITPPLLTCPEDQGIYVSRGDTGTEVTYPAPIASDNSGNVTLSYSHESGGYFSLGMTAVLISAEDSAGNSKQCMFSVNVNGKKNR